MTGEERRERSRQLAEQLKAPSFREISSHQLGKATYAWLLETKAAEPYDTPTGAAQTFGILRKGTSVGEMNIARTEAFLAAIEGDPAEFVARWAGQNGTGPDLHDGNPARELPPELVVSEETQKAMAAAFGQVKLLYDQKKAELTKKEDELHGLRSEVRQMEGILKAAGIIPRAVRQGHPGRRPPKEEPPKKQRQTKGSHVSNETAMKILEQIKGFVASNPPVLEDVPGSFTRPQIERGLGLHHSQVGAAVEKLREQGYIRAAGLTQAPSGQKMNVFAVIA